MLEIFRQRGLNLLRFVERWRWGLILALFAICVALKLNGSSIGIWQAVLKEDGPIRGLLLFKPQEIRGDEWCHVTPSILSQARHLPPFPIENESLGGGCAPLLMSVPVAYYTTLFRPQLWGFFVFDFEHAFAFYWCCKIFGLLLASSWLLRQAGIKSKWIAAFGSIWIFFSSFVQWWFSSPAMLPEMLACWAMLTGCALNFFSRSQPMHLALASGGFVFFGMNFVLCMYPGFQVPLLYVSAAILVGASLQRRSDPKGWRTLQGLGLLLMGIVALILLLLPFWWRAHESLQMVAGTSYPGVYRNSGGGLSVSELFSGVAGFFESGRRAPFHYRNICEASNFYPLWAAALPVATWAKWRKNVPFPPLMLTLAMVIILIGTYCTIPVATWLAHGSFLSLSGESRLLVGIGIAGIVLCCVFFDSYPRTIFRHEIILAAVVAIIWLSAGLWLEPYPAHRQLSFLILIVNATILGLFFLGSARNYFFAAFVTLLIVNGAPVNPIMSGLAPLTESRAFIKINDLRSADSKMGWVFYESLRLPQLGKATGAAVLNGAKILPDLNFMRQLDPDRQFDSIYNRFAYIIAVLPEDRGSVTFTLKGYNNYEIGLPPEHPALRAGNYGYVVFPRPWMNADLHGYSLADTIEPTGLYIYKRQPGTE